MNLLRFKNSYSANHKFNQHALVLIPLMLVCFALSPRLLAYDFEADFSITSNPNGVWSYGWSTSRGSVFNLNLFPITLFDGQESWFAFEGNGLPVVEYNASDMTITSSCCNPLPPGAGRLHPGPNGENAVLRWTAPANGAYQVSATFSGGDWAVTSSDVAVLMNDTSTLYAAEVNGYGPPSAQSFFGTVTVATGDTIDFTVGFGINGNYFHDGTLLTATITPTYTAQVQPPINADRTSVFNVRRGVVPVKFTVTSEGVPICDLPPATIALTRTAGGVIGSIDESDYSGPADTGSNFRIDSCQYVYNLSTSALGVGTYRVDIIIDGQVVGSATFGLQ